MPALLHVSLVPHLPSQVYFRFIEVIRVILRKKTHTFNGKERQVRGKTRRLQEFWSEMLFPNDTCQQNHVELLFIQIINRFTQKFNPLH